MLFNNFYLSSFPLLGGGGEGPWFAVSLVDNLGARCHVSTLCSCQEASTDGAALGLAFGYFVNVFLSP